MLCFALVIFSPLALLLRSGRGQLLGFSHERFYFAPATAALLCPQHCPRFFMHCIHGLCCNLKLYRSLNDWGDAWRREQANHLLTLNAVGTTGYHRNASANSARRTRSLPPTSRRIWTLSGVPPRASHRPCLSTPRSGHLALTSQALRHGGARTEALWRRNHLEVRSEAARLRGLTRYVIHFRCLLLSHRSWRLATWRSTSTTCILRSLGRHEGHGTIAGGSS